MQKKTKKSLDLQKIGEKELLFFFLNVNTSTKHQIDHTRVFFPRKKNIFDEQKGGRRVK